MMGIESPVPQMKVLTCNHTLSLRSNPIFGTSSRNTVPKFFVTSM